MTAGRLHHYLFAHRETRDAFFREPAKLLGMFRSEAALEMARHVWSAMGDDLSEQGQPAVPDDGLAVSSTELAGRAGAVITMPTPAEPSEAWFVAMVAASDADGPRYFTLEKSVSLFPDPDTPEPVMLCEWTADGKHLNYGPARDHSLEGFEAMIEARLGGATPAD